MLCEEVLDERRDDGAHGLDEDDEEDEGCGRRNLITPRFERYHGSTSLYRFTA